MERTPANHTTIEEVKILKKFSFSLDKVLDYKIQIEDNLRTEHAGAVRAVARKEEEIEEMEAQHRYFVEGLENVKREGCRISELMVYQEYLGGDSQRIREQKEILKILHRQEEEKRNEVIEAKKERTSIDMLKDKKLREHNFAVQKDEERFIEEFVANSKYHAI